MPIGHSTHHSWTEPRCLPSSTSQRARVPALERLESYCLPSCGIDISLEVIALTPCQCSSEARMSSAYSRALGSPQRHTNGTMDRGLLRIFSIHDHYPHEGRKRAQTSEGQLSAFLSAKISVRQGRFEQIGIITANQEPTRPLRLILIPCIQVAYGIG